VTTQRGPGIHSPYLRETPLKNFFFSFSFSLLQRGPGTKPASAKRRAQKLDLFAFSFFFLQRGPGIHSPYLHETSRSKTSLMRATRLSTAVKVSKTPARTMLAEAIRLLLRLHLQVSKEP